jgi:hypothetical protein
MGSRCPPSDGKSWTSTKSGLAVRLPLLASVLEVADQLLVLGVDGDDRNAAVHAILSLGVDVLELRLRSGCCVRSTDLLGAGAGRLDPCSRSSLATVLSHSEIPCSGSVSADSVCVRALAGPALGSRASLIPSLAHRADRQACRPRDRDHAAVPIAPASLERSGSLCIRCNRLR